MADHSASSTRATAEDPVYALGRRLLQLRDMGNKYDALAVSRRSDRASAAMYVETVNDAIDAVEAGIGTTQATSLPGAAVQLMLLAARLDLGEDLDPDAKTWRELQRLCLSALRVVIGESGVGRGDIPLEAYVPRSQFPDDYPEAC